MLIRPIKRSPFNFPAGRRARLSPSHVASAGVLAAAINTGSGFSLVGNANTPNLGSALTQSIDGNLGPVGVTTSNFAGWTSGLATPTLTQVTLAVLFRFNGTPGGQRGHVEYGGTGTLFLDNDSLGHVIARLAGAANIISSLTLVTNHAYFVACSVNGTTANFIIVDLATGQTSTQLVSATSGSVTTASSFAIAADANGQRGAGSYAAAMAANSFLSLQQLQQWGAAPWSFWYPD